MRPTTRSGQPCRGVDSLWHGALWRQGVPLSQLPRIALGRIAGAKLLLRRRLWGRDAATEAPITNPASAPLRELLAQLANDIATATGEQRYGEMFQQQMLNTWERTLTVQPDGHVFVITGDIPAMWLRDSSAQLRPFLVLLTIARDRKLPVAVELQRTIAGVCAQQWRLIGVDPYANAFNRRRDAVTWQLLDLPAKPQVWERKYEIDSLAFPVQLAWNLWRSTDDAGHLTDAVRRGCQTIVELWRREQHHETDSDYRFIRLGSPHESLPRAGKGTPVAPCGLTWSGFRPSDDPTTYGYNIPAQLFAVHALRLIDQMATDVWLDSHLAVEARALARDIDAGVGKHGLTPEGFLAYEVDGFGNHLIADDANMPSLLSLPLCSDLQADDPLYLATRDAILSERNPYFYRGQAATGIGSPHTPGRRVWPIALAVQALTSNDAAERAHLMATLANTEAGTGMMHESFDADDPRDYTRPWFSWANSMWCELLLSMAGHDLGSANSADETAVFHRSNRAPQAG